MIGRIHKLCTHGLLVTSLETNDLLWNMTIILERIKRWRLNIFKPALRSFKLCNTADCSVHLKLCLDSYLNHELINASKDSVRYFSSIWSTYRYLAWWPTEFNFFLCRTRTYSISTSLMILKKIIISKHRTEEEE